MIILIAILFWLSVAALLHTYVIYPLGLKIFSSNKKIDVSYYLPELENELPAVNILMAVYNEETVIKQKLDSLFQTNYPVEKINVLIGSDGSTDKTNTIIENFTNKYPIQLHHFGGRSGKPHIINQLYKKYKASTQNLSTEILILTDANVLFDPDTIYELVKYFKDAKTGIAGAAFQNTKIKKDGIGALEKKYVSRENEIKHFESILFKKAMGVFGGCYALRADLFHHVPSKFIVDDFFISMKTLQNGFYVLQNLQAIAYEDLPGKLTEEFRRKRRIGAGNIQNLGYFKNCWWPPFSQLAFIFFSHKILRWFGPFLLLCSFFTAMVLAKHCWFFKSAFIIQLILVAISAINYLLKDTFAMPGWVKFIGYFYAMNLALLFGFFDYFKGIQTNVWKPTERNI